MLIIQAALLFSGRKAPQNTKQRGGTPLAAAHPAPGFDASIVPENAPVHKAQIH